MTAKVLWSSTAERRKLRREWRKLGSYKGIAFRAFVKRKKALALARVLWGDNE